MLTEPKMGHILIYRPREGYPLHGPEIRIDVEVDGKRWIGKFVSVDREPFAHGVEKEVEYQTISDRPLEENRRYELYVGSRNYGYIRT
jgi:hypothetical protein